MIMHLASTASTAQACDAESRRKAMDKAMRLLAARSRSRRELAQRLLAAGFEEPLVDTVGDRLEELGLLNDVEFARQLSRSRAQAGWSSTRIAAELHSKGVDVDVAGEAIDDLTDLGSEEERACRLAEARAGKSRDLDRRKALQKVVRYLLGKGYEPDLAWEAARSAFRALDGE